MSVKTPNYILVQDCTFTVGIWTEKVLPSGSFVRPIDEVYLPDHVKQSPEYKWWRRSTDTWVYSSLGIVLIDKKAIREI